MLMARAPRPAKRGEGGPDPERGEGEGPGEGPLDNGCPSIHGQNLPRDVRRGVGDEKDPALSRDAAPLIADEDDAQGLHSGPTVVDGMLYVNSGYSSMPGNVLLAFSTK